MPVQELLNPLDEEDSIQNFNEDNCRAARHEPQADIGVEDDIVELPTLKEQLHAVGFLQRMVYVPDTVDDTFVSNLRLLHAFISREPYLTIRQTTIENSLK